MDGIRTYLKINFRLYQRENLQSLLPPARGKDGMGVEFQPGLGSHPHLNPPPLGGGSLILRQALFIWHPCIWIPASLSGMTIMYTQTKNPATAGFHYHSLL